MSWLTLQVALLAGYLAARLGRAGAREARWILALSLVLPWVHFPRPVEDLAPLSPSVATAPLRATAAALTDSAPSFHVDLAWIIAAFGVARLAWAAYTLHRTLRGGVLLHRLHGVRVYAVPGQHFAAWWFGRVVAVDPDWDRLALRHELQHHRHGDAIRAWALLLLGVVAEPMATVWRRFLAGEEEVAVDRALLARGVDARRYASVLAAHAAPVGAPAPALARSLLRRRIQMLLTPHSRRSFASLLAVPLFALVLGAAPPSLHVGALPDGEPMNDVIAGQIAHYTAGKGVAWAEGALSRRDPALRGKLEAAGLPGWLEAVAFVESGFRADIRSSLPESGPSAGYWQFIPATARTYGLRVNEKVDDRLNVAKSTAAAIALLSDLYEINGDWPLALASYNEGQQAVNAAIAKEKTRDAWELQRRGALNHYAARVYAAAALLAE